MSFFVVSAIFHYLGPSLAVLLFARIAAPGVLWLRISARRGRVRGVAAAVAAGRAADRRQLVTLLALGGVLAGMNALFYLAVARLPLATVGAIDFLGTVVLAALGARTRATRGAGPVRRRRRGADRYPAGPARLAWCSRSATAPASCSTSCWATGSRTPG